MSRHKIQVYGTRPPTKEVLCVNCGCVLAPNFELRHDRKEVDGGFTTVPFYTGKVYGYGYENTFCTRACGFRYGIRCVKAGVQLERLDPVRSQRKVKKPKQVPA